MEPTLDERSSSRTFNSKTRAIHPCSPLLLLGLAVFLVGCGVPVESEPQRLDIESALPVEIEERSAEGVTMVTVHLVRNERLLARTRDMPGPPGLETVMSALLGGTTALEDREGLRTAIPSGTRLLGARREGSVASLDLSGEFVAVGGEEEILAVAQIVLTVTSLEGISAVLFELEGIPTGVPVAGGALSTDPVDAVDYAELVGP